MEAPLVSVICTCFNHAAHIEEALQSVAEQSYDPLELSIIDNGSGDDSVKKIQNWVLGNQQRISLKTLFPPQPLNYCQSFNLGLAMIRGKFLIDLSGDDVLLPGHADMAVKILEDHPSCIYFSNALLIKEGGVSEAFYP